MGRRETIWEECWFALILNVDFVAMLWRDFVARRDKESKGYQASERWMKPKIWTLTHPLYFTHVDFEESVISKWKV